MAHDDPNSVKVTLLLCDGAQSLAGKLYILGGGWAQMYRAAGHPILMALAMRFEVPWSLTNHPFKLGVYLRDVERQPVDLGDGPVQSIGTFEIGRPPGTDAGTPLVATTAVNFGGMVLPTGRYVWDVELDDVPHERTAFEVLDLPQMPGV